MSDEPLPQSGIILYQTEDGRTRIQCRFENKTLWLTQVQIAELFQTSVPNINLHLKAIYAENELTEGATIKSCLMVRIEGGRQVSRPVMHYNLPAILAVGFRVRSHRGTQFRQWATARLGEYLVKGFTMDDERLKNHGAPKGRCHASPGQRPGLQATNNHQALKGRPNPCHNLLPVCTFTSFLAPKIESESFPTGFVIPFTLTWRPCCKTLVVPRCLSIPSRTTFMSSSSWPALLPSVQLSRRSKKPRPSGSRHRARSSPDSRGRQVMVRLRFPNPTCPPSVNTSPGSSNITGRNRFRRNTGRSWSGIGSPSMNGMCGIDAPDWPAPSGLESFNTADPGRCPGLVWGCPVGAQKGATP